MKTKYLFYSLALAGAFAACSQEELIESPVAENNIANRPVAGVVEFTTGDIESRFNYEKANGFELGDVFGLYLMDEFKDGYPCAAFDNWEHGDANTTLWKWQDHWFGMYQFTNNIQSNYPFRYVEEAGKKVWKNDAKLVEGNYFAMFPQNEKALNRRELWHVIDPSVELKTVSSSTEDNKKYQHVENQFWLGYKQIYRDATASAEGVMKMDINMKGALVPLRISLLGWQGNDVKLDKISFKDKYGQPLPTLAYVEPASLENGEWPVATNDVAEKINCGKEDHGVGLYDEAKTWTKNTVQNLVRWAFPGEAGKYPYGLTEAEERAVAYEYNFDFPAETILKGDVNNGDLITAYIVVPALNSQKWNDLQVTVYGWRYIKNASGNYWEYGLLSSGNGANYTFILNDQVNAWLNQDEGTKYYRDVEVRFDNFAWTAASEEVIVASTEDMEKMVLAHLQEVKNSEVELVVRPDAEGIEIRSSFIKSLEEISGEEGRDIEIVFDGGRQGKIYFNENNTLAIDKTTTEAGKGVKFTYRNGIKLINNAVQTIPAGYNTNNAFIENNNTLNVNGVVENVENNQTMSIGGHGGYASFISNYGDLTLKCNSTVDVLHNQAGAKTNVEAAHNNNCYTATVNSLVNGQKDVCDECVSAELNVINGTLKVITMNNHGVVNVAAKGTIDVENELTNKTHVHNNVEMVVINNEGKITGVGIITNLGTINNYGIVSTNTIKNYGTINNNPSDVENGLMVTGTKMYNYGVINAINGKILKLYNGKEGVLYVLSETVEVTSNTGSQGKIIFVGVAAEHVGTNSNDTRIFRTVTDMVSTDLVSMMNLTATTDLWTAYNILLKNASTSATDFANIKNIVIEGNKVNFSGKQGATYTFENAVLLVNKGKQLHIEGGINVVVNTLSDDNKGTVHVGSNSTLKDVEGNVIEHTSYEAE